LGRGAVLPVAKNGIVSRGREKVLGKRAAFLCYCPAEKYAGGDHAEPAQDEEPKAGGPRRVTRCSCRNGKPSTPGVKPAIRFKVPLGGTTRFLDAVFGAREFSNDEIEDFVLLRSGKNDEEFGQSMYQLGSSSTTSICASPT